MIRLSDTENVDAVESAANDTHRASDGTDHAHVVLNDTHRTSDGQNHSNIQTNIVDIVIAVADGAAGPVALTADIHDLTGTLLAKTGVFKITTSLTQYAGAQVLDAAVTFGAATLGIILASGNGWAVVQADAAGNFACDAIRVAGGPAWFSCVSCDGGHVTAADGVIVRGCLPDDATWA